MDKKEVFKTKYGSISQKCIEYYNIIHDYAENLMLTNTLIALDLACELHEGTFRESNDCPPYVIHPLDITRYLIMLNVHNAIYELHDAELAKSKSIKDLDILLATNLLHDVMEDCLDKLPNKKAEDLVTVYKLDSNILKFVSILTKDKQSPGFDIDVYYKDLENHWVTLLSKVADRTNNCSTISAFAENRMEKYVNETKKYFYSMCSTGKLLYPEFSRLFTVMKYLIVSICENVASALNLSNIIISEDYTKTYYFLKGFAIHGKMQNTLKAIPLARKYYNGMKRTSGDPFIIHPLRVASYLISLKIDDDAICAAAILHEIINTCHLNYHGAEILTKYHLDPLVLDYIRLMSNSERYPLDIYYDVLAERPEVFMLLLSNKANTCTRIINYSKQEIQSYVKECEEYIYPTCQYSIKHYPEYADSIQIMFYHISSICEIVKALRLES